MRFNRLKLNSLNVYVFNEQVVWFIWLCALIGLFSLCTTVSIVQEVLIMLWETLQLSSLYISLKQSFKSHFFFSNFKVYLQYRCLFVKCIVGFFSSLERLKSNVNLNWLHPLLVFCGSITTSHIYNLTFRCGNMLVTVLDLLTEYHLVSGFTNPH